MAFRRACLKLLLLPLLAACRGRAGGGTAPPPVTTVAPPPATPITPAPVPPPMDASVAPPPPPALCAMALDCGGAAITSSDIKVPCRFEVRDGAGVVVYADHAGVDLH